MFFDNSIQPPLNVRRMLSPKTLRCPADLSLDDTKNQKQRDFVARYVTQEAEWLLEDMETTATEAD